MDELKPCQCGGEAEIKHQNNVAIIGCKRCPMQARVGFLKMSYEWALEKAKEAWNNRADGWVSVELQRKLIIAENVCYAVNGYVKNINSQVAVGWDSLITALQKWVDEKSQSPKKGE